MAKVEIIAKLKQKNDADFKIADAKDIEMEDGSDLQSTIDNIKKNGTNIDTEKYATKEELETKAEKEHTHDYNDITNAPTIPSIEGLATEDYVDTAIANAQLNGGEIDTSNFATKEDLNAKVDKKLGYSLVSDDEINRLSSIDNYDDTEIKNELNNKSDLGHTHSYTDLTDTPTIPSIEGLATESYVKNEIANAQLSGGEVDLSGYATKEELNNKVDKLEGYSLISDSEIIRLSKVDNYDDTNIKSTLDSKANKTDLHSHDNKEVLDGITNEKISNWDSKAEGSHTHSYKELTDKPNIPSIEGLATETFVTNKIAEAQLSQGEIDLSGYATKEELNDKADKTHTHIISDIDNLQTALNNKANTSDLHSHSNKSVLDSISSANINNWNNKSEFSGSYNDLTDKPTIPSLDGYATETFVTNKIAEAQLSGEEVDLSGYATKDELNTKVDKIEGYSLVSDSEITRLSKVDNYDDTEVKNSLNSKANKTDLHSHANKNILDGISSTDVENWNNKSTFSGDYNDLTNKPTLHSHSNKTILDNITASKVSSWDSKSDFSGSYNDLTDTPIIPTKTSDLINDSNFVTNTDLNKKADKTELHSHINKTILDSIGSDDIDNWNSKTSFDGDYNSLTNKPTIPTNTSDLINDSNFVNTTQLNTKVDKKTGYSLVADTEIERLANVDNYDDTQIKNSLNNKSDIGHTHSYNDLTDKPTIPSIEGLATETFVTNKIAEAQLAQGEIDLSGYATKDDLVTKADKSELHSHDNKIVLDGITSDKVASWDNKSEFSGNYNDLTNKPTLHSHSNKEVLDTITDEKIIEWDSKSTFSGSYNDLTNKPTIPTKTSQLTNDSGYVTSTSLHSHTNKAVLDGITADKVSEWDNKSDFSGDYNDLTNKPTIPTVDVNKSYVDTALSKKVDKKTGYSLVADTEIERLANVDNYDDTEIKASINTKANSADVYTKTQTDTLLSIKANTTDLHSHSNKTILDTITVEKVTEWDSKSTFSGSYNDLTDKPTIPTVDSVLSSTSTNAIQNKVVTNALNNKANSSDVYTKTQTDTLLSDKANKADLHSHSNKTVLDTITNEKLEEWDNKSDFSGSYNDLTDKPIIDNALSTTSTNAIQNKVVANALDGKADSSHTHNISDVTNLQTILDGKSDTSHTHNYAGSSSAGGDATNALACSGNATTATKLQTARTINGTSFDGSANITTNTWGIARNITIGNTTKTIDGSDNISWTLREIGIYDSIVKIVTTVQELESALSQGGVIYIVEGTYQLGENVALEYVSNTHLIALGDVTISINTNSSNYIAMRPKLNGTEGGYTAIENFNMSGITFDGKGTSNKAGLFATAHGQNIHIEGCTFKNLNSSWHLVEINSSNTVVFDRCTFSDYNYRDIAEGDYFTEAVQLDYAGEGGLYPFTCLLDNTGCKNVTFNNCTFTRVKTTWTACLGSHSYLKGSMPENITLNGCTFYDIDNCIYGLDYKNLTVLNSTFTNVATAIIIDSKEDNDGTSITVIGNRYSGWGRSKNISQFNGTEEGRFIMHHNYSNRLSSSNISNNFIEGAYSHGIGITPVDTTIIGNSIRYCGKHGIYLYGGQQTSIIGNTSVYNGQLEGYTGYDIYVVEGAIQRVWRCNISNNASYVTILNTSNFEDVIVANNLNTKG